MKKTKRICMTALIAVFSAISIFIPDFTVGVVILTLWFLFSDEDE